KEGLKCELHITPQLVVSYPPGSNPIQESEKQTQSLQTTHYIGF
ncbi:hypothetical protein KSS87_003249, partial [Heliosperma pusillum]